MASAPFSTAAFAHSQSPAGASNSGTRTASVRAVPSANASALCIYGNLAQFREKVSRICRGSLGVVFMLLVLSRRSTSGNIQTLQENVGETTKKDDRGSEKCDGELLGETDRNYCRLSSRIINDKRVL